MTSSVSSLGIAVNANHSCAILSTGAAKCWGANNKGQIGDNSTTTRLTATQVTSITTGATMIAAGALHTCAVVNSGLKCWGQNTSGQIGESGPFRGHGTTTQRNTPTSVSGLVGLTASVTKYYMLGGQPVAMSKDGAVAWLHTDHLGSASLATNASGLITSSVTRYKPWGEVRVSGTALPTDRRYDFQREETSVGLVDMKARLYSPLLGRFISADAIIPNPSRPQSNNRYSYVENRPVISVDSSGHFMQIVAGVLIGGVVGAALSYGSQVANNLNQNPGMSLQDALTTNIDGGKILKSAGAGAVAGGLIAATGGAALIGGGLNLAGYIAVNELTGNANKMSVEDGLVAFAAGTIGGAISGASRAASALVGAKNTAAFMNNFVAPLSGAIANLSQYAGTQIMNNREVDTGDAIVAGVVGAVAGRLGGAFSRFAPTGIAQSAGSPTGYICDIGQGALNTQRFGWVAATFGRGAAAAFMTNYTPSSLWRRFINSSSTSNRGGNRAIRQN